MHQKRFNMIFTKIHNLTEVADNYDVIMFDLWGVLIEGGALYPNVGNAVNSLMKYKKVLFVSNAPRTASFAADRLRNFGIHCRDEQMFTSGQMSKDLIDSKGDSALIYHLSFGNEFNAIEEGYRLTADIEKASLMLLTAQLDEGQDLHMFNDLFERAVAAGVHCICANPDKTIPNKGKIRYCAGYFADIYEKMGGKVTIIGKPGKDIFIKAISGLDPKPNLNRVLMIGDTIDTDILGAKNAGICSGLVLTGNAAQAIIGRHGEAEILKAMQDFCEAHDIIPDILIDITR